MANLLVLHPDKAWVDFLELALLPEDHRLIQAKVGTDALFKMKNERFDLIVAALPIQKFALPDFLHAISTDLINFKVPILLMLPPGQICEIPSIQRPNRILTIALPEAASQLRDAVQSALGKKTGARSLVHAEFVNQVLLATRKTFQDMAQLEVVPGKPYRRDSYPQNGIVGYVPVTSPAFEARIAISLSEEAYREILGTILGPEGAAAPKLPKDGIAEILNVLVVSAKRPLNEKGYEIAAARPEMLSDGSSLAPQEGAPKGISLAVDFAIPSLKQTFTVEIILGSAGSAATLTPTTQSAAAQAGSGTH